MKKPSIDRIQIELGVNNKYCHTLTLQRLPHKEFVSRANDILSGKLKIVPMRGQVTG